MRPACEREGCPGCITCLIAGICRGAFADVDRSPRGVTRDRGTDSRDEEDLTRRLVLPDVRVVDDGLGGVLLQAYSSAGALVSSQKTQYRMADLLPKGVKTFDHGDVEVTVRFVRRSKP